MTGIIRFHSEVLFEYVKRKLRNVITDAPEQGKNGNIEN